MVIYMYEGRLISSRYCFITETLNRKQKNKMHHKIRLLKTETEVKYHEDISKNKIYMKQ